MQKYFHKKKCCGFLGTDRCLGPISGFSASGSLSCVKAE